MIKTEQIPYEVMLALHDSIAEDSDGAVIPAYLCRAALAAALNAWEGAHPMMIINGKPVDIVLPLQDSRGE